jgi:hypothetical protein
VVDLRKVSFFSVGEPHHAGPQRLDDVAVFGHDDAGNESLPADLHHGRAVAAYPDLAALRQDVPYQLGNGGKSANWTPAQVYAPPRTVAASASV